jgi:hypothetical protein
MTPPQHPPPPSPLRCLASILALLVLCACESDQARHADRGSASAAPPPEKTAPEMEAHGTFFSGQIQVETLLNRVGFAGKAATGGSSASSDFGGGGGHGGGHRHGPGSGSSPSGGGSDSDAAPLMRASNLPPLGLHLRLTNLGSDTVDVEVTDFNSDLGDFVVQPEVIVLPPKTPVEAEPMVSRLGADSDAIPLSVTLRLKGPTGEHRTEKQVLVLKVVPPVAPPIPAPKPPT